MHVWYIPVAVSCPTNSALACLVAWLTSSGLFKQGVVMVQSLRCSVALALCLAVCLSLYGFMERAADAARIKDLTSIAGVRDNQLIGYGLVVGLNGSGD